MRNPRTAMTLALVVGCMTGTAVVPPVQASSSNNKRVYQLCWWEVGRQDQTFDCLEDVKGPSVQVDVPADCWDGPAGGTVAVVRGRARVVDPNIQYTTEFLWCKGDVPYASYGKVLVPAAKFAKSKVRFTIPNGQQVLVTNMVLCMRSTKSKKFCAD